MAIQKLRRRTLADKFANDVRASRRKYGRYVYIGLVFAALFYLADLFIGPYVRLDVDGMITSDRLVISTATDAQVVNVEVTPGQRVVKGQHLGSIVSPAAEQLIAELKTKYAETASKLADFSMRLQIAQNLEKVAAERLAIAESTFAKLSAARTAIATDLTLQSVARELADARLQAVTYQSQREGSISQLRYLTPILEEARESIAHLERSYNNGQVVATEDGIVGTEIAQRGDALKAGDRFVELSIGRPYVLGYLNTGTIYEVKTGDKVRVYSGFHTSDGVVTEVLPIAVQLPPEFQKTFRPRGRGQVAKIAMTDTSFPLNTKVEITGGSYIPASWLHSVVNTTGKVAALAELR